MNYNTILLICIVIEFCLIIHLYMTKVNSLDIQKYIQENLKSFADQINNNINTEYNNAKEKFEFFLQNIF